LGQAIDAIGVTARVMMIGAHPDDEDTFLIAWLSRGRQVQTAYLSLTRGDGGQNLIGNELGEALGVIRTEELYAARRVDGAQQFFTRAFDFGFSKDTVDTFRHWPRDEVLGDVVSAVRAFRPHVIVAVFSGTPRDGHGHHQVSGILARDAFRFASDTVRFPRFPYGTPWTPLKLYGNARYDPAGGETMRIDVGEYSPLLGRSYAEIAGESRSQHKSQGFGAPQRKGPFFDALRREMTRVNESTAPRLEKSIFDGIDTSLARFRNLMPAEKQKAALDSLPDAIVAARRAFDPRDPSRMMPTLARLKYLVRVIESNSPRDVDARLAIADLGDRVDYASRLASGVEVEAFTAREVFATGKAVRVIVSTYNRGRDTIHVNRAYAELGEEDAKPETIPIPPAGVRVDTVETVTGISQPHWLERPRAGAMFRPALPASYDARLVESSFVHVDVCLHECAISFGIRAPVVHRTVDPVRGEVRRDIAGAPAISVTLDQDVQYAPANQDFRRALTVRVRSADDSARDVRVRLTLPRGMIADSNVRAVKLEPHGAEQTLTFQLRGRIVPGRHQVAVTAESGRGTFTAGYQLIDYDHIRRRRIYRPATTILTAIDLRVPSAVRVAYVPGVSDNVAPMLTQLGISVTVIQADEIGRTDLSRFNTVVIGPRAYEAHPDLEIANHHILEFARRGGTVVVQYGQSEMTQAGIMPYPITINRPHDRVTHEDAPVRVIDSNARELRAPNRIDAADFDGWVQERALYMPRTFDPRYRALLETHDPGEPPSRGAILVAPLGRGTYIFTTLSFFRQLPAGVPGAARLFVNLLSAGTTPANAR
jgi:LmbE family N-acetylglucosaminyl deacetylase